MIYKNLVKPILFLFDPEDVHNAFTFMGKFAGKCKITRALTRMLYKYKNPKLEQDYFGIHFENPLGLSAGFDYNINLPIIMGDVGFAFASGGTVTFNEYEGNPRPRLRRLPESKSLLVHKGFKSAGIKTVLDEVEFTDDNGINIGISIGATNAANCATSDAQIEDIINSMNYLVNHEKGDKFAYYEINISCPNTLVTGALATPETLEKLLSGIRKVKFDKPLFLKFQLEIQWKLAKELIEIMIKYKVDAIIIANLLKKKSNYNFNKREINEIIDNEWPGNFSGMPVQAIADDMIGKIYKEFGDKIKIIGVGGVFQAEDAYYKIKQGASLIHMISGMIFNGPGVMSEINKDLVALLEKDGYNNISEAIGANHKKK